MKQQGDTSISAFVFPAGFFGVNSGNNPSEPIVEANEVLTAGQGAQHTYPSYKLSRYACYLIVQNADLAKEVVAIGQTYFAVQTFDFCFGPISN